MNGLAALALAAANILAPGRDHSVIAEAIGGVVDAGAPLFADDDDKRMSVAFEVVIAYRESGIGQSLLGDCVDSAPGDCKGKPQSFCFDQIYLPGGTRTREGWTGPELVEDPQKCARVGDRMMRESLRDCGAFPVEDRLASYARGRCDSKSGRRISRDRDFLARSVAKKLAAVASISPLFLPSDAASVCATEGQWRLCADDRFRPRPSSPFSLAMVAP